MITGLLFQGYLHPRGLLDKVGKSFPPFRPVRSYSEHGGVEENGGGGGITPPSLGGGGGGVGITPPSPQGLY